MRDPLHLWSVDRLLVCVPAGLPDPLVRSLRAALADAPSVDAVLDLLTADGLAATPPFLCAASEADGVRVVVRGAIEAVAHGLDGSSLALGAGRSATWNDDVVTDIASISIDLGDRGAVEWIAARGAPLPAAPAPTPVPDASPAPAPRPASVESHTLDEEAYLQLVAEDDVADAADEPQAEPETAAPHPPADEPAPTDSPASAADALDFSGLLDHTRHGEAESPAAPPARPAPPPQPAPDPAPAPAVPPAEPTVDLPVGVVPPRPASRPTISAVPLAGATAPAPAEPADAPVEAGTGLGEHDGRTVTLADLRRLQEQAGAAPAPAPVRDGSAAGPARPGEVRAVRCPAGHANPPTATSCRLCGQDIADTAVVLLPRPVIARLVFDSGLVVEVDRPQLIGRRPTAPPDADELPNLVTVPSPDGDISRAHTAVRVEGWDVLVEDVGSTNGTEVRLPNRDPVRLREHDPVLVVAGTEVTLAGTVRFTVEPVER